MEFAGEISAEIDTIKQSMIRLKALGVHVVWDALATSRANHRGASVEVRVRLPSPGPHGEQRRV